MDRTDEWPSLAVITEPPLSPQEAFSRCLERVFVAPTPEQNLAMRDKVVSTLRSRTPNTWLPSAPTSTGGHHVDRKTVPARAPLRQPPRI